MKKVMMLLALLLSSLGFCQVQITDLEVTQLPSFGKVIVEFNVDGGGVSSEHPWWVTCTEVDSGKTYSTTQVATVTDGRRRLEWDMAKEGIRIKDKEVTFTVGYWPTYLVVDLSGGTSATSYPVTTLAAPPEEGWTDEYKTTKLVLRVIEAGSFKMNGSYDVTISKPFYMGVFEVTQKQYQLVTGSNPAYYKGDARPVEYVSWNTIRGNSSTHNWPSVKTVDANSFMGKIRAKSGLELDLPTEAQWEYACRAGTTSEYNNGGDTEADLKTLGRYYSNGGSSSQHAKVGSYLPNAWGLYDMHGNVWEWCLDWYGNLSSGTDPKGATSGSSRVDRGGCFDNSSSTCTSSRRGGDNITPSYLDYRNGFRLACPIELLVTEESELITMSTYIVATEMVDGIEWAYEVLNGEAKVYKASGESAIPNMTTGAITIPSFLGGYSVTAIGDGAFKDCTLLTSVTIPESVISLGDNAFHNCSGLTSLTIPASVRTVGHKVFEGCVGITKVKLPLGGEVLSPGFYEACFTDKQVIDTERSIKDYVTRVCDGASMFYVTSTKEYTTYAYGTNMYFEGGVTYYFSAGYDDKSSVKVDDQMVITPGTDCKVGTGNITFETSGWHWLDLRGYNHAATGGANTSTLNGFWWWTSVDATKRRFTTEDGDGIFRVMGMPTLSALFGDACVGLQEVEIVGDLDVIPASYFSGCTGLTSIVIPEGVTSIGKYAFEGCTGLTSIALPDGLTSIEENVFAGCTGLTSVMIPSSVTSIGKNAFPENVSIAVNGVMECSSWPVNLPKSVQASIIIPDGTTEIGDSAFKDCTGLTSVTISNGVTSIGGGAFSGCTSLTSIVIPQSVEVINTRAFYQSALEEVIFEGIPPKFPTSSVGGVVYTGFASAPLKRIKYLNDPSLWKELLQYYKHSAVNASDIAIPTNIPWIYIGRKVKVVSSFNGGEATSSSETCAEGDVITVTATPKEGYVFLGWSSDAAGISGVDSTLTFTMPDQEEVILVANFFPKALLEGWMDARIDAKVDGETLLTAKQASAATEASISQKVADGELLTPAGAATQTEKVINQKVADGELITSDQLQVMAMEAPVIAVEDGVAKVGVSLKRAASLEGEWEEVAAEEAEITDEGAISVSVPADGNAAFYKFVVPEKQ